MREEDLEHQAALYALIQNNTRKNLLRFIYQEPRTYTDLIQYTGLKPGSLYHHLNLMTQLVEKRDHGLYAITSDGKYLVTSLELVDDVRPQIVAESSEDTDQPVEDDPTSFFMLTPAERMNQIFWLGVPNVVLLISVLLITTLMAIEGVAVAGIAIYAAPYAGIFSFLAFGLGFVFLYYVEKLVVPSSHPLQSTIVIRVMGNLPASIVALVMYLLFMLGIIPVATVWTVLFVLCSVLGYSVMVLGLQYLQGISNYHASLLAAIPAGIDILIGFTILLVA